MKKQLALLTVGALVAATCLAGTPTSSFATTVAELPEVSALTRPDDTPTPASEIELAANTVDSKYSFKMQTSTSTSGTKWRPKDNATSVYVRIKSHTGAARMFVDGAYDSNGYKRADCTTGTHRAKKDGQWRIPSDVNERGFTYARLTAWGETGAATVIGEWSPDCTSNSKYSIMPA